MCKSIKFFIGLPGERPIVEGVGLLVLLGERGSQVGHFFLSGGNYHEAQPPVEVGEPQRGLLLLRGVVPCHHWPVGQGAGWWVGPPEH